MVIVGDLDLGYASVRFPVRILRSHLVGAVYLSGASLAMVSFAHSRLHGSMSAVDSSVSTSLSLHGTRVDEGVNMNWATVEGLVDLTDAELPASPRDYSLTMIACRCAALTMIGLRAGLEVNMIGARIAGQLQSDNAQLSGVPKSFVADALEVGGGAFMSGLRTAGTVRLFGAHITGHLHLAQAVLGGEESLLAGGIRVDGLTHAPELTAAGEVNLSSGRFADRVNLVDANLDGPGESLIAEDLTVAAGWFALGPKRCAGTVVLGPMDVAEFAVPCNAPPPPLSPDSTPTWRIGSITGSLQADPDIADRWLSPLASPQPREEFAAAYDRAGHPQAARRLRYLSAVRTSRSMSPGARLIRGVYRIAAGYGYYPWRALGLLGIVFAAALVVAVTQRGDFTAATTPVSRNGITDRQPQLLVNGTPPGRVAYRDWDAGWDIPAFEPAEYAATTAIPAATIGSAQLWSPPPGPVSWLLMGLKAAAWVLTALLLAALTGLLRKPT